VLALGALTLTACGSTSSSDSDSGGTPKSGDKKTVKVGLAYDIGGRGDQSFNDAAARGLDKAEKQLKVETKEQEPTPGESDADKVERLKALAENGYNPVIGVGFAYAGPIKKVAKQYPKINFAVIDDASVKAANVANLVFKEEEGSFLVGAAAALKTKTNVVGFVGGVEVPLIDKFDAGFQQGVNYVAAMKKKKIEIKRQYLTQPPDMTGFADVAKGKTAANGQLDDKADVIYHAAGASGGGVIEAAAGKGAWAIGVDSDQYKQESLVKYQKKILTSMVKNVDGAVFDLIKSAADGKTQTGIIRAGLKEGGVSYATSGGNIDDIKGQLEKIKADILSGKVKVKASTDELKK
jgi:basic membrane protein A